MSYFEFFFWNIILDIQRFHIVYTFQGVLSEFFFNFKFSSRKSQNQQKLAKKITHFTIQFHSKNLIYFMNLNLSLNEIENNMLPQHSQKPFFI